MEPVPDVSTLKSIVPHPVVKCIPPKFESTRGGIVDLFMNLAPPEITAAAVEYTDRVKAIINTNKEKLSTANSEAKEFLIAHNLPGSIDAGDTTTGLPDSMWTKIDNIQRSNGDKWLNTAWLTLSTLKSDVQKCLGKVKVVLQEEAADDDECRRVYGGRWNRNTSSSLTISFTEALQRYATLLEEASKPDVVISSRIRDLSAPGRVDILTKSRKEIDSMVPSVSTKAKQNSPERVALVQALSELDVLINSRADTIKDMETMLSNDPIKSDLMGSNGAAHEDVFAISMSKYTSACSKIQDSVDQQRMLCERIKKLNEDFEASKAST